MQAGVDRSEIIKLIIVGFMIKVGLRVMDIYFYFNNFKHQKKL